MSNENIHNCSKLIGQAKRIYFLEIGYSSIVCEDSNYKFMSIGLNSYNLDDSHKMITISSIMNEDDLVIPISHFGETKKIIKAVENTKNNNIKVISITEEKISTLKNLSDINLGYISRETIFETGSILSKLGQIFIMNLIYTQVVKDKYSESISTNIKTTNAISSFNKNK